MAQPAFDDIRCACTSKVHLQRTLHTYVHFMTSILLPSVRETLIIYRSVFVVMAPSTLCGFLTACLSSKPFASENDANVNIVTVAEEANLSHD